VLVIMIAVGGAVPLLGLSMLVMLALEFLVTRRGAPFGQNVGTGSA
jgi:hypothetical protein